MNEKSVTEETKTEEKQCLFEWDKIPGDDDQKLNDFLKKKFNIQWVNEAEFKKISNDMTIEVSHGENFLELQLNPDKTRVTLTIDDGRTDEYIVEKDDEILKICDIKTSSVLDELNRAIQEIIDKLKNIDTDLDSLQGIKTKIKEIVFQFNQKYSTFTTKREEIQKFSERNTDPIKNAASAIKAKVDPIIAAYDKQIVDVNKEITTIETQIKTASKEKDDAYKISKENEEIKDKYIKKLINYIPDTEMKLKNLEQLKTEIDNRPSINIEEDYFLILELNVLLQETILENPNELGYEFYQKWEYWASADQDFRNKEGILIKAQSRLEFQKQKLEDLKSKRKEKILDNIRKMKESL